MFPPDVKDEVVSSNFVAGGFFWAHKVVALASSSTAAVAPSSEVRRRRDGGTLLPAGSSPQGIEELSARFGVRIALDIAAALPQDLARGLCDSLYIYHRFKLLREAPTRR
jgi:hypothetical protein